jgi:hypothetical protein
MSETPRDIFVRAHTVVLGEAKRRKRANRAPRELGTRVQNEYDRDARSVTKVLPVLTSEQIEQSSPTP